MAIFAIPYLLFSKEMMGIFTSQPSVVAHGVAYLRIVYLGLLFVIVPIVYGGALKGGGYTYGPMVASIFANAAVKLGLAYMLSSLTRLGVAGVWWAISISVVAEAIIIMVMERRKDWKSIKI